MVFSGRVMGAAGILAGLLTPSSGSEFAWRGALLPGKVSGPPALPVMTREMPAARVPVSTATVSGGGLLVGIGVAFGSGCTSGHGVCGMARLSPRSIAATLTFMIATLATVYVVRHFIGG